MADPARFPSSQEIERLRSGLRILALRSLGDPHAAEEVAQESLCRALEALRDGKVKERERLGAFVRGICRHVIADTLKARGRTVRLDGSAERTAGDSGPGPLRSLISEEERDRVSAALRRLSERDRELLRLLFYEGMKPADVADRLGVSSARIRKRKQRALERLRKAYRGSRTGHEENPPETIP